ncbi:MAG: efflux RND transporter periplasmic adaptor subunit [Bacteroidota bacterium]|nr:efflux RND transporter periplasmic adaptor subunit [Bacteroidota bacterium]
MRKIDRRIVIVVSVLIILLVAYGLMRFLIAQKEAPPVRRSMEARRYVRVEPVKYSRIASEVSEKGRLSSIAEIDIVAEASGKIQSGAVVLKKGSKFSKGDVLFEVYPDEAILSLKARKSQYQNTLAGIIPDLVIDFPEAEEAFTAFFSSIEVDKALPPMPEIQDDKLKIFLASRNVISEYYSIQRDELQLRRRTVLAPFNGTYREVYMELGAYTNTGGRVARAIQTDHLEMEAALVREEAAWVNVGDPVQVVSESRSLSWKGTVIRKGQFVDENTQSQTIFIRIKPESKQTLLAGEYLTAVFPVRPIKDVMEIPRNAVFNSNEVFVVRQGRLAKEKIEVIKENDRTLIFKGIPEGDTIVVQQLINVSEGTVVQTDKDAAMTPERGAGAAGQGPKAAKEGKKDNR